MFSEETPIFALSTINSYSVPAKENLSPLFPVNEASPVSKYDKSIPRFSETLYPTVMNGFLSSSSNFAVVTLTPVSILFSFIPEIK